jgi:hypothetical protein
MASAIPKQVWLCLVLDCQLTMCDPLLQWGSCGVIIIIIIITGCSGVSAHRGLDLCFLLALLRFAIVTSLLSGNLVGTRSRSLPHMRRQLSASDCGQLLIAVS